ncbi:MAG TPA: hypothetical protein VNI83_02740 [Vicinamibacterales bacterium]|nr:hypothetical protein [Vicinamibacterales bacterium]
MPSFVAGLAVACSQPTQPSRPDLAHLPFPPPAELALAPGRHWFTVSSIRFWIDSGTPLCAGSSLLRPPTDVVTEVLLERQGERWIGRASAAADGDLELQFQAGARTLEGIPVRGTIRGSAIDFGYMPFVPPRGVRVIFGDPDETVAYLEGTGTVGYAYVRGEVQGAITFRDSQGYTASCRTGSWSLQPIRR